MTSICTLVSVSFSKLIREENMLVWVRDSHIMWAPILKNQPFISWSNPKTKFTRSTHNLANWRNPKTHKKTHNDPQENPSTIACNRDRSPQQVNIAKSPRHTGDFKRQIPTMTLTAPRNPEISTHARDFTVLELWLSNYIHHFLIA